MDAGTNEEEGRPGDDADASRAGIMPDGSRVGNKPRASTPSFVIRGIAHRDWDWGRRLVYTVHPGSDRGREIAPSRL